VLADQDLFESTKIIGKTIPSETIFSLENLTAVETEQSQYSNGN